MIALSIILPNSASPWRKTWDDAKVKGPAALGETDLRYKYFGVGFRFAVGGIEIVPSGRMVTLVDLLFSLSFAVERISSGQNAALGFTESDDVIRLRQAGDSIIVTSSMGAVEGSAIREEFLAETVRFVRESCLRLVAEVPDLSMNPTIRRLRSE